MKPIVAALISVCLACRTAGAAPAPLSSNPDDSPVRSKSGKVFPSTDASVPPALGPRSAPVLVVVLSDFQCPVCRRSADATQQLPEEFPGDVRVEFWQHPLAIHRDAENAAVASLAAQRQGKFWEYHDELFRHSDALDASSLVRYAEAAGLDVAAFRRDCDDPALRSRVRAEASAAEKLGAAGTPAFLVNGKLEVGWGSWVALRTEVEREVAEARKLEAAGTPRDRISAERARSRIASSDAFERYREIVLSGDGPSPAE